MRCDPAFVDLNHLVQTPHSSTLLLLVHLASIPGVSTAPPCSISQSSSIQMCERKRTLSTRTRNTSLNLFLRRGVLRLNRRCSGAHISAFERYQQLRSWGHLIGLLLPQTIDVGG